MKYSKSDLLKDFKSGGVKSGISLIVHSSLKSIGYAEGGAEAVIGALRDAEVRLINAKDMFDFAVDLLRKEPYFLLVDYK